jgi:soluble lytic murein transglycosylase-like protein
LKLAASSGLDLMSVVSKTGARLVPLDGPAAADTLLERPVTCIGRAADNDIVIAGEQAATVSAYHLEVRREGEQYCLHDHGSTNGTYVNGRLVSDAVLEPNCVIQLGPHGPEFLFEIHQPPAANLDATLVLADATARMSLNPREEPDCAAEDHTPADDHHDALLAEALKAVRSARRRGEPDQTAVILRKFLHAGIKQSSLRLKKVIAVLLLMLAGVTAYGSFAITDLQRQQSDVDAQIGEIESRLEAGGQDPIELEQLIARLTLYQQRAQSLQDSLLYQFTEEGRARFFVRREIETLLAEFGATEYNTPPEFVESVYEYVKLYQGADRPNMARALGRAHGQLDRIRKLVENNNLPGDLAYMALVESAFVNGQTSRADAAGLWQFRPETAQQFGLIVNEEVDERFDVEKSTNAAARYIRSLILEFGSGHSVMLALAAYNTGPARVRQAVRKVEDPIKQRNFWHLYRVGALPRETREYVPKIFAAIIIGRHPEEFGF